MYPTKINIRRILVFFVLLLAIYLPSTSQTISSYEEMARPADTIYTREMRFQIQYPINKTHIHETYMSNAENLKRIKEYLWKSPQIDSIVIYSYASPEGPYHFNKKLAYKRGQTAKKYILSLLPKSSTFNESLIHLRPEAENWDGLNKEIIENYHENDCEEVMAILNSSQTDKEKKRELIRLNGGEAWRHIIKYIMPKLRYATWITVWETIPQEQPLQRPKPMVSQAIKLNTSLPVLSYPTIQTKIEESKTILAIKTNLLYDLLSWTNFSVEVPIKDKFSALYYHQFPWWRWGENSNEFCDRFLSIGIEGRWWFKPMPRPATINRIIRDKLTGHFLGVYAESGKWDFERKRDICYQGEHWSAGLSYGYAMPIGKRLNLEFSISAGYASIPYRGYTPSEDYELLFRDPDEEGRWHYFGLTKAQVSLVLPIVIKYQKGGKK